MKRLFKAILLSLVALLLVSMPVLAAVAYRAAYTIVESNGTAYDMLANSVLSPNQWLADNGFMQDDALDTRIETLGGLIKPHMVATNKTLTAVPVPADSQTNLYFTTANPDLPLDIIAGYNGYITITDDDTPAQQTLELGDTFEIEIDDAYINTDASGTKNLVYKEDAFRIFINGATNVTSEIDYFTPTSISPYSSVSDGFIYETNVVYNTAWISATGTKDDAGVFAMLGQTTGFTVYRSYFYFDTLALPDDCTITSATLKLYGSADNSDSDFLMTITNGQDAHPEDPLVVGDFDKDFYSGDGGSLTTVGFNVAGYNNITLNATGLTWINKTGTTKLCIRSSEDIAGSAPTNAEYVAVKTTNEPGVDKDPQLVVNYDMDPIQVTATNVTSGQHDIRTWADGNKLYISVDSATAPDPKYDEADLNGASATGNTNDWLIMDNSTTDFMPYMGYYKHTTNIGGYTLKAWYQPNTIVVNTSYDGTETAGGSAVTVTDNTMGEAPGYWVNALVTITEAGGAAPEGEARVCTVFAAGGVITVAPAFSANVDIGDTFTIEFGTLIDRSYYGLEFDAVDDIVACGADASMDITDEATLTAWVYIDSDGENNEGSIIDRRDATPDGYRLYVSSEAAGDVAIEAILDGATDAYAVSNVEVSISGWHYIVAVYNRLGTFHWEIYEDGVLLGLGTDQAGVAPITGHTANVMNIGDNAASNRCFDGKIDEPSFYTTAWTQALVTANYNVGAGLYTPTDTTSIALQLHMEESTGVDVADTSGEANNGTITNAVWVNGKVPRPAGNAGTNDSRVTWGANPTGVSVALGGMVSEGQPTPGVLPSDPAQDILLETEVSDWYVDPDLAGLLDNPLRPLVTMMSGDDSPTDTNTLTEIQAWRILALAVILMVTVATALAVGRHQGITMIVAGAAILGAVVLTIFPMWALVFAIGMFIGGLVMERAPSL